MVIEFVGELADRATWQVEHCSIAMTMDIIGTRSSMLILREAYYGTTRFDDFARRTHVTEAVVADRLKELTAIGLFEKEPYREPGKRTRYEYVLTSKGRDLAPVVLALMQWGNRHLQPNGAPLRLVERGTGDAITIGVRSSTGRELGLEDLSIVSNTEWLAANSS